MTTYNFSVNSRLSLNQAPPSPGNVPTTISGLPSSVLRAPPPPPPSTAGHLMAMHHPLISSGRPILISHQGFPLTTNHQFFGDGVYSTGSMNPTVHSSGLNDAPLEFNILKHKAAINDQSINNKDKVLSQNLKQIMENHDKCKNIDITVKSENKNHPEKERNEERTISNINKLSNEVIIEAESDEDDCQVIHEIQSVSERGTSQISATTNVTTSSQSIPILSSNNNVWNNFIPNVNFSMLGVNQMLATNVIDSNLFIGQNLGIFGNVFSQQLPSSSSPTLDLSSNSNAKTIIHYKSCTLFPPNANTPAPTTRDRPSGCKTVFVGGLPENMKEEIIREIFGFCGEIMNVRLSNKKFCHIRFSEENAVDQALTLSGYRIRLGSSSDPPNTGRLHVDFAHARDDQYEWECKQRQIQREQRHRERLLRENSRDVSPTGPSHFTESEANNILEKLKGEETFLKAISVAVCWLERGECNKRNVNIFYSMIQSINSHVRRLIYDKNQCETDFKKAKDLMKNKAQTILSQFAQIEKLFISSLHKKVWDHFTKAQRKNIEVWKKTAMEIKKLSAEIDEPSNDEMDVSDSDNDEGTAYKKRKMEISETNSLKDENDSLRCQLEAYKNEICVVRTELQCEVSRKNEQITVLQKTLNTVSKGVEKMKKQQLHESACDNQDRKMQEADTTVIPSLYTINSLAEKDAKLIGLISIFLHIHPFGAGVDYICSFLQKTMPSLKVTEIEHLMNKFPSVFQQEVVGIGANMERRWKYTGFNSENEIPIVQL